MHVNIQVPEFGAASPAPEHELFDVLAAAIACAKGGPRATSQALAVFDAIRERYNIVGNETVHDRLAGSVRCGLCSRAPDDWSGY